MSMVFKMNIIKQLRAPKHLRMFPSKLDISIAHTDAIARKQLDMPDDLWQDRDSPLVGRGHLEFLLNVF